MYVFKTYLCMYIRCLVTIEQAAVWDQMVMCKWSQDIIINYLFFLSLLHEALINYKEPVQ